jgi:hypothetical protein
MGGDRGAGGYLPGLGLPVHLNGAARKAHIDPTAGLAVGVLSCSC